MKYVPNINMGWKYYLVIMDLKTKYTTIKERVDVSVILENLEYEGIGILNISEKI